MPIVARRIGSVPLDERKTVKLGEAATISPVTRRRDSLFACTDTGRTRMLNEANLRTLLLAWPI